MEKIENELAEIRLELMKIKKKTLIAPQDKKLKAKFIEDESKLEYITSIWGNYSLDQIRLLLP
ncbi:MAG: hypothetical protein JWQ09_4400 [Segetibacter sp.]|nr:hypothetical protein [Segetibacter sp.]